MTKLLRHWVIDGFCRSRISHITVIIVNNALRSTSSRNMEFRINHFQKFCGAPTKLESKQQPSFPHIDQRSQLIPNAISGTSANQSNTPTIVCDRLSIGYDFLAVLYNDRALSSSNCLFRNRARGTKKVAHTRLPSVGSRS